MIFVGRISARVSLISDVLSKRRPRHDKFASPTDQAVSLDGVSSDSVLAVGSKKVDEFDFVWGILATVEFGSCRI